MNHNVRKLLGYGPKDPIIVTESDADDVVEAYRDLVQMAKGDCSFDDLVDGVANFLDACADMDPDGALEKAICAGVREKVLSDEFKDQVKSSLSVMGEARVWAGACMITESMDEVDAMHTGMIQGIRMSRDFSEVAGEVTSFLGKLKEMNSGLAASTESEVVNGVADYLAGMKKAILAKAKQAGVE